MAAKKEILSCTAFDYDGNSVLDSAFKIAATSFWPQREKFEEILWTLYVSSSDSVEAKFGESLVVKFPEFRRRWRDETAIMLNYCSASEFLHSNKSPNYYCRELHRFISLGFRGASEREILAEVASMVSTLCWAEGLPNRAAIPISDQCRCVDELPERTHLMDLLATLVQRLSLREFVQFIDEYDMLKPKVAAALKPAFELSLQSRLPAILEGCKNPLFSEDVSLGLISTRRLTIAAILGPEKSNKLLHKLPATTAFRIHQ